MKSKRIERNEEIFNRILKIEEQYLIKVVKELIYIEQSTCLSANEIRAINAVRTCLSICISSTTTRKYNDKYYRGYDSNLQVATSMLKNHSNIWIAIQDTINEGQEKISNLVSEFENPKKILSINTMYTQNEYDTLRRNTVNFYIKGRITIEELKHYCYRLDDRAKTLGLKIYTPEPITKEQKIELQALIDSMNKVTK